MSLEYLYIVSLLRIGDTAVIAGVNGPVEAKSQKMMHDRVSVEVTYTPLGGPASKFAKLWITIFL